MSESKDKMIKSLKKIFVTGLREIGFQGTFPHFKRITKDKIDLLTFQFGRSGGEYCIEISFFLPNSKNNNLIFNDKPVNIKKINAWNMIKRKRLLTKKSKHWFVYHDIIEQKILFRKFHTLVNPEDRILYRNKNVKWIQKVDNSIYDKLANESLEYIEEAEKWWESIKK